jgi:hypothetical protein
LHQPKIEEISNALLQNDYIFLGKFPAGNAINCLCDVKIERIMNGIVQIDSATAPLSSNTK